jgi:hypothetical protein
MKINIACIDKIYILFLFFKKNYKVLYIFLSNFTA